jgi:putative ABC transport system ATP-binding protein
LLSSQQRASVALARSMITQPELFIVDGALAVFGTVDAGQIVARLQDAMAGRTLVMTFSQEQEAAGFDDLLVFEGARMVSRRNIGHETGASDASEARTDMTKPRLNAAVSS